MVFESFASFTAIDPLAGRFMFQSPGKGCGSKQSSMEEETDQPTIRWKVVFFLIFFLFLFLNFGPQVISHSEVVNGGDDYIFIPFTRNGNPR